MTATACLHVLVSARVETVRNFDVLTIVGKATNAYLESRWAWPRKFAALSKTCYLLSDPRAATLDAHELKHLSSDLQVRLFGVGDAGDVSLAIFEGSEKETQRFARLSPREVLQAIEKGLETLGFAGRLTKVKAHGVEILSDPHDDDSPLLIDTDAPAVDYARNKLLYRGVYLAPKQQFIGSVVSRFNPSDHKLQSILDGPSNYPTNPEAFDSETVAALVEALPDPAKISGHLLLPMNYSALTRRSSRERYADFLRPLVQFPRELMTAVLYDAPRMVQYHALVDIKAALAPYFGHVDLCVADPGIDVAPLEQGSLRSITLSLSSADDDVQRDFAIKRFLKNRDLFREKQFWPMVGNVRSRHELRDCMIGKSPFVYGPAVTEVLETPVGMLPFMAQGLPVAA